MGWNYPIFNRNKAYKMLPAFGRYKACNLKISRPTAGFKASYMLATYGRYKAYKMLPALASAG
jgi:hypothetical protein